MPGIRVMHYLNQFFAGIGGEEQADHPVEARSGALGPGRRLQALCGDSAEIVVTAYCGDNFFATNTGEALQLLLAIAKTHDAGLVVAGPAFNAGRYGFACVEVCHAASASLGIGGLAAMYVENPGIDGYRLYKDRNVHVFPTPEAVSGMEDALSKLAACIRKLATGAAIGSAVEEGYVPRGIRVDAIAEKDGAERGVDMLLDKLAGRPYVSEIPIESIDRVPPAPRIPNLAGARLALANTSAVVPDGNPDHFKAYKNTVWGKYQIDQLASMREGNWDVVTGGHNSAFERENPNYAVPLDVCREFERAGVVKNVYSHFYSTVGNDGSIAAMEAIGQEWVADMKANEVDGVLLVST